MVRFIITRKKVQNIRIRVSGDGAVAVSAPVRLSKEVINDFVKRNAASIIKRRNEIEEKRRGSYPVYYETGDTFLFLGNRITLKVKRAARAGAKMEAECFTLYVPDNMTAKQAFIRWALNTARAVFSDRIAALAACGNIKLSVRRMLTRWGSINTQKRTMSLTVHLLRCEPCIIDYVIMHELCHLKYTRHSKAFYGELEKRYPNRRFYDKKLSEYGLVDF
ncbi:MAG: YgjP-like metallopeptidase domain-containing protein [Christensenellales bacterium]